MKTVLIVDDEKNIRSSLATTFRLEGYRVELDLRNGLLRADGYVQR